MEQVKETISERKDKVILGCSSIFTDISEYIEKYEQQGFSRKQIFLYTQSLICSADILGQMREKLMFLTSDVRSTDEETEKFAKVAMSIAKNIKFDKNQEKHPRGKNENIIKGLLEGKCICSGITEIFNIACGMVGIETENVGSQIDPHAWSMVKLQGNWYNWDQTNIMEDVFLMRRLGKGLRTDRKIIKLYKEKLSVSDIACNTEPSKSLVTTINRYAKMHRGTVPKMKRENFFSNLRSKILNRIGSKPSQSELPESAETACDQRDTSKESSRERHSDFVEQYEGEVDTGKALRDAARNAANVQADDKGKQPPR